VPILLMENVSKEDAEKIRKVITAAGGNIEIE
jgi:ribosomal protein L7/L12